MCKRGALRLAALAVTAALAACGGPSPHTAPPQIAAAADLTAAPAAKSAPVADELTVAAVAAEPTRLKGMAAGQLKSLLGAPTLIRRDYPAEVWQYAGKGCVLDLYLYDEGGAQKVTFYQLRQQAPVSPKQCLSDLMAGKRAG